MAQTDKNDLTETFLNSEVVCDDFFISIVEKKLEIAREDFKLKLVLLFPAAGKNENYASMIYRVKIKIEHKDGRKESVQAIIKALLEIVPAFKDLGVFPRERRMYKGVISSFQNIWEEVGIEVDFGPKSIKFETDPYEIIVMDDLAEKGYVIADRKIGVDFNVAKLVLSKLAKFHAASAIRFETDGFINPELNRKNLKKLEPKEGEPNPMQDSMGKIMRAFHEAVESYGEEYSVYADKIKRWSLKEFMAGFLKVAEPMRCGLQILTHGDVWVNNFMIKYDSENNPIDVLLIDFQMSFWSSPAPFLHILLIYFFISSLRDDIKVERFDDLVEFYHSELFNSLKTLNYKKHIPTFAELQDDMVDKGFSIATSLIFVLFVCKLDSEEVVSMDKLFKGGEEADNILKIIYNNEYFAKACKTWLPFLNQRGFLNSLL